jgi:hypothetical protein
MNGDVLWGAIIGAGGSILGGFAATGVTIWRQNVALKKVELKQTKKSAGIIYNDILGFLKEMTFISDSNKKRQGHGSHTFDYSSHISAISKELNIEEIHAIHVLYGFILKFQKNTMQEVPFSEQLHEYLQADFHLFCEMVYGTMGNFNDNVFQIDTKEFNYALITRSMRGPFISALNKIKKLKD